ncbi:MAG: response regulator [Myxococcales bacterium]|nr:response regulator [Myxococcales bacterium]
MPTRTVLVIDTNPSTAQRVADALAATSFSVRSATSLSAAEAIIDGTELTAVISALTFPSGNGYDLAKSVKAKQPAAAVFLITGGFEVYQAARAEACGVDGRLCRPLQPDAVRTQLEGALGPISTDPTDLVEPADDPEPLAIPGDAMEAVDPSGDVAAPFRAATAVADERIGSFIPRDWNQLPLVRVDPNIVGPAVERAILELLPEVVEAVLRKALSSSRSFRDLVEVAVDDAVRDQLPDIARRVIRERLAEFDAARSGDG